MTLELSKYKFDETISINNERNPPGISVRARVFINILQMFNSVRSSPFIYNFICFLGRNSLSLQGTIIIHTETNQ